MKSSLMKKQTNLPQNQSKIKEKSASDHMSLAQRKLNNFQKPSTIKKCICTYAMYIKT